ncbi:MAG TPA: hypothetical protein VEW28_11065 [Candidatus Kapabacteria bacterium]|nr:hypothetical protein [Candidatus Kapabacteria bacterium]
MLLDIFGANFDLVKALGYGCAFTAFVLIYFSFKLIKDVIDKPSPNQSAVSLIKFFMGLSFAAVIVVGIFGIPTLRNNDLLQTSNTKLLANDQLKQAQIEATKLEAPGLTTEQIDSAKVKYNNAIDSAAKVTQKLDASKAAELNKLIIPTHIIVTGPSDSSPTKTLVRQQALKLKTMAF